MKLFNRKQKVSLDDFCRDFYNDQVLHPIIKNIDMGSIYFDTIRESVTEADPAFDAIEPRLFVEEMANLRFEIFGLAWLHELGDKHAAAQSVFTKRYLVENGMENIWEALDPYNQAIARSSTHGHTPDTPSGRAYLAFVDSMRMELFGKWLKLGFDAKCLARAANRLSTDVAWKNGLTPGFLMLTLCDRLSCELNEEAQFRLVAIIRGFYDGAREALKDVSVES